MHGTTFYHSLIALLFRSNRSMHGTVLLDRGIPYCYDLVPFHAWNGPFLFLVIISLSLMVVPCMEQPFTIV